MGLSRKDVILTSGLIFQNKSMHTSAVCWTCHHQLADQEAVIILEKTPIREDTLAELLSGSTLKLELKNDIYSTYRLQAPSHLNG